MFNVYGVSLFFGVLNFFVVYGEETPGVGLSKRWVAVLCDGVSRSPYVHLGQPRVWRQAIDLGRRFRNVIVKICKHDA